MWGKENERLTFELATEIMTRQRGQTARQVRHIHIHYLSWPYYLECTLIPPLTEVSREASLASGSDDGGGAKERVQAPPEWTDRVFDHQPPRDISLFGNVRA